MMRLLCCAAVLLLASGPLGAEEKDRDKQAAAKPGQDKKTGSPGLFDHDRFIKENDRNKDGALSREELPSRLRYHFDQIDVNKDSKLSREELDKGVVYLQQRRRPSDVMFILLEMSDCDECCAEEMQNAYDLLRKVDRNQNGKIESSELEEARRELVAGRIDAILKELDSNKDSRLSHEEAQGLIRDHFKRLDRNGDRFIERDELLRAASEGAPGTGTKAPPKTEPGKEGQR